MKKYILSMTVAGAALLISGCATSSSYRDAYDTDSAVKNKTTISSSDWIVAAQTITADMLISKNLDDFLHDYAISARKKWTSQNPGVDSSEMPRATQRPLLMLNNIANNTGEHIDTKLLTQRIVVALQKSSKVRYTTYAAGQGQIVDTATAQVRDLKDDPNVRKDSVAEKGKVEAYDLSLTGVIIKQKATDGKQREISYTFNLTLTNNVTGEAVWVGSHEIKRGDKRGGIGW